MTEEELKRLESSANKLRMRIAAMRLSANEAETAFQRFREAFGKIKIPDMKFLATPQSVSAPEPREDG